MPYILLAVILASFGAGFGSAYKIEHMKVEKLELSIERAKVEFERIKDRAIIAQNEAEKTNKELDNAHKSAINTVNAYYDKLRVKPVKTRCRAVSESDNSRIDKSDDENRAKLLAELLRADRAAIDKNELLDFVMSNCGISQ